VDPRIQLVQVDVTTDSPYLSQALARRALALVSAFNQQRRQSQSAQEAGFIGARLQDAKKQLSDAEDSVARFAEQNRDTRFPSLTVRYERLQREVTLRQGVYAALLQRYEQSRIEEVRDTPVLTVVQQPDLPARPDSRHVALKLLLALMAGTLVMGLLVLWRARLEGGGMGADGETELVEFQQALGALREQIERPLRRLSRSVAGPRRSAP
jgi:uncharacterized protein involved in exopolysaccharide biosynthesis